MSFSRNMRIVLALLLGISAVACRRSFADTLTLNATGGQSTGGVYVYPYYFSYDGSSVNTPMMCVNYNEEITFGETWQVQSQTLSTSSSVQLQEDAWLYSQVGQGVYDDSDIQFAVWDVLDPGTGGNPGLNSTALGLVTQAENAVPSLSNTFLGQFTLLSPTSDKTGWTAGKPQSFIVDTSAVTPEPSTLLLLGTGLCGASLLLLRRRALEESREL